MLHERDRVLPSAPWEPEIPVQPILAGLRAVSGFWGSDPADSGREDGLYGEILTSPLDLPAARRTASRNGVVGAPAAVPPAPDLFPGPRPSSLEPIALPHPNSQPTKDLSRTNAVGCAPGAVLKSSIHPRAPAHRPALNRGSSTTPGGPASPPPAMRPRPARSSPPPLGQGVDRSTPDRRPGAAGALFVRPGRQARPPRVSVAGRDLAAATSKRGAQPAPEAEETDHARRREPSQPRKPRRRITHDIDETRSEENIRWSLCGVLLYDEKQIAHGDEPSTCGKCQRYTTATSYLKRREAMKAAKKKKPGRTP